MPSAWKTAVVGEQQTLRFIRINGCCSLGIFEGEKVKKKGQIFRINK
jgi:hypothetical protein